MRILFMGSGEIALPTLRWLIGTCGPELVGVVTQPDKPVGRHQVLTPPATKVLALESNIPVFQPLKVRDPKLLQTFSQLVPDVIVVMAYGQILPRELLELPKIACLNLHASLLPRHRGASPIQSAILEGDETTGITLMHMDVGLDTGDIVLAEKIPISPDETAGSLHDRLANLGPEILQKAWPLINGKIVPRTPQDPVSVTHTHKLDRESGWIDWCRSALEIERQIRAMHPWPGAYTLLPNGKKIKIHRAHLVESSGSPGEILASGSAGLVIGAGTNAISLDEIQPEGKSRMTAQIFSHGNPLSVGDRLRVANN